MKQINLSNKKLNIDNISDFNKENIQSKCGKPLCGLWFSRAIKTTNSHIVSEWHNHVEFSWSTRSVKQKYLTNKGTTYVTSLALKESTKLVTVKQIEQLFIDKSNKAQIIKELNLKNINNLVLKIDDQKDLDIITKSYPEWDSMNKNYHSKFWQYVTQNFVGCEFSKNLFNTIHRLDSDLIYILDVPSFVVFNLKQWSKNLHLIHLTNKMIYMKK
jgi:hypothetical protein